MERERIEQIVFVPADIPLERRWEEFPLKRDQEYRFFDPQAGDTPEQIMMKMDVEEFLIGINKSFLS